MSELDFSGIRLGFAVCGSFCTMERAFSVLEKLVAAGADILPIMSDYAYATSTRFGDAETMRERLRTLSGKGIIHTIEAAEPIGPKGLVDALLVANCTGNTLGKLAASITDTSVTMAVKSHLRNNRPVILSIATNDALAGSAKNIGALLNYKNYYFVPIGQDDSRGKPSSLISDFSQIPEAVLSALDGKQLQPMLI